MLTNDKGYTYIGITNNLENRLKCHNSGKGAKATRYCNNWWYNVVVGKFDKSKASRFEWLWKHKKSKTKWKNTTGIDERISRMNELLGEDEWTNIEICEFD